MSGLGNPEILSIRGDVKFTRLNYPLHAFGVVSNRSSAAVALSDGLTNYYREARWRALRRKSAWNILLSLFCIGSGLALWYVSFRLVWALHVALYPAHRFNEFWRPGIRPSSLALS